MNSWEAFYGPNAGYALELYERYRQDPTSVDAATRAFFDQQQQTGELDRMIESLARPVSRTAAAAAPAAPAAPSADRREIAKIVAAARLARSIREYGHLDAEIDPLGSPRPGDPMLDPHTHGITDADLRQLPASIVWPSAGPADGTCLDAIHRLRAIYCGPIGYEFDHVEDFEERTWLHAVVENGTYRQPLSPDQQKDLLRRLTEVDGFERFLHTAFQGQKRFSIEGNDALVPMLNQVIDDAAGNGMSEIVIGMAHRGRLAVLAHILGMPLGTIFRGFQTAAKKEPEAPHGYIAEHGGGDVKYHKGAHRMLRLADDRELSLTLADNPSHLEYVNPAVEGFARAAQDDRSHAGAPVQDVDRALAITIHGDAAFPGEGVVAETLNLSALPGYSAGGLLHIIVNNQVGFTTDARAGRSTLYASDLAKGFEIPIVHVNADDPEACLATVRLAWAYRARFHKDFLIDLVGYRRWGHNEGDEPAFTQPMLYARIHEHLRPAQVYAQRLIDAGVVSAQEAEEMERAGQEHLRAARNAAEAETVRPTYEPPAPMPPETVETAVSAAELHEINEALLVRPEEFTPHARLDRLIARRREAIDRPHGIDWAHAEALAFGAILRDGTPIRFSGQDTERGTFSQRHLVLHDPENGQEYTPLQHLPGARASFAVYNSPLTEAAVLGFEYGYSIHAPDALVLWEAQYGDFANAGQVLIDQFIAAARSKWQQLPALALLLPHGYEGGGPEHSSARLERFLQLAADGSMRVTNPSTAAQYFHLLRYQAATLGGDRRPLIVMTPKSLLRRAEASSSLDELTSGHFQPVLDDRLDQAQRQNVERLLLAGGKVAIDLAMARGEEHDGRVALVRVEQLYPFPKDEIEHVLGRYPDVREVVWVQEEPANMGAWTFVAPRLRELLPPDMPLQYVGRPERASTAAGSPDVHEWEQARLLEEALGARRAATTGSRGK